MKRIVLFFVAMAAVSFASAQSFSVIRNGEVLPSGERIVVTTVDSLYQEMLVDFSVKNNSDHQLDLILSRDSLQGVEGMASFFCWDNCYPASVSVSNPESYEPGETKDGKSLHYAPDYGVQEEWLPGTAIYKYSIFDRANPSEVFTVEVWFAYNAASLNESVTKSSFGAAYPNPAVSTVSFQCNVSENVNASLFIYNLLGQKVKAKTINKQGRIDVAVDDMQEGIYFCNFVVNGQVVKTEKFIVKH